jgi:predicted TIM-barrel fold metal-dependent hydrolase
MNIIDCHANIGWDTSNLRKNYFPTEQKYQELMIKMNKHGISKAIILPFPSPSGQFRRNVFWYEIENQYLMQATNFSNRFIPFPAVNPNDLKSINNVQTLVTAYKIKGIKISHHIPMGFSVNKLINHPLMKILHKNNLILMLHTGTGKEPGSLKFQETLSHGIKVAKKYPEIKFIFCHLGRLHKSIIEALKVENIYMDTSAISMKSYSSEFIALHSYPAFRYSNPHEIIEELIDLGFENKIIFGSDEPYTHYNNELDAIKDANISNSAKEKIYFKNISKLLGIKNEN